MNIPTSLPAHGFLMELAGGLDHLDAFTAIELVEQMDASSAEVFKELQKLGFITSYFDDHRMERICLTDDGLAYVWSFTEWARSHPKYKTNPELRLTEHQF